MKNKFILHVLIFTFLCVGNLKAVGPLDLHFKLGLSTPEDKFASVYSDEDLEGEEFSSGDFFAKNAALGYHLGVIGRIDLSDKFDIIGGIEFHRFPNSEFSVEDPSSGKVYKFKSVQNIVPVIAGLNFVVMDADLLSLYAVGNLAYNYISNSVDYVVSDDAPSAPFSGLDFSPDDSRIGVGIGAGVDIDLQLLMLNVEGKFNQVNLIGKEDGEETKNYYSLSLGIVL